MSLEFERELVARGLADLGLGWDTWPGCAATAALDGRTRLAALLLLLGAPDARIDLGDEGMLPDAGVPGVLERVRRRALPWDPATAALALDIVLESGSDAAFTGGFNGQRVGIALRGAEQVCAAGAVDLPLLERLERCRSWLDDLDPDWWMIAQSRLLLRRILALTTPPDLLDLSLIVDGDGWGEPARVIARDVDPSVATPLVRVLGELGGRKPSQRWLAACGAALRPEAAQQILRGWLEQAARTPIAEPDDTRAFSGGMLFASGNDDLVRAAVLATRLLPSARWVPTVLGELARRGAASSLRPGMTDALSLKVAGAAVDSLTARATPGDRVVLEELLTDLSRRDLVRRVGRALGREHEAAAREEELRRTKAAAVRAKADPAPRRARAEVDKLIRRHVAPELRRLGFEARGRTWRRFHEDRVDLIALGSGGDEVSVTFGVYFDAVHPSGEPDRGERAAAADVWLDLGVEASAGATEESMQRLATQLVADVVPFLDGLGRYELVRAHLDHGTGTPPGAMATINAGSPASAGVLGLLALAAGDWQKAVDCLQRRLAFAESYATSDPAGLAFWRHQLERARRQSPA